LKIKQDIIPLYILLAIYVHLTVY